jgi:hypothetical protein
MLISHSHRFIFVHVDKVAGTSLKKALEPFAQPRGERYRKRLAMLGRLCRINGLYCSVDFAKHSPATTLRRCLPPAVYDRYFKFAFVRNPWDRLVSRYHFLKQNTRHRHHPLVVAMSGFGEYARWEMKRASPLLHQRNYVCDRSGKLIVDFIGRFESLGEDFAKICERLDIPMTLPHLNSTERKAYLDYYEGDDALRDEVGRYFAKDIELFGYCFEGTSE